MRQEKSLESSLPTASKQVHVDAVYNRYRRSLARWFQFAAPAFALMVCFLLGLALFLWKLTQTSDFALRYSNQAHYEIGVWMISLGVVFVLGCLVGLPGLMAARRFNKVKEEFTRSLRDALAVARDASATREVIEIERMLSRIENAKPHLPGQWDARV
jgi:hypothetical protein